MYLFSVLSAGYLFILLLSLIISHFVTKMRKKCILLISLMEKSATLESIQTQGQVSGSESSVISVGENLDLLGGIGNSPTLALKPSEHSKWVTPWWHYHTAVHTPKLMLKLAHGSTTPLHFMCLIGLLSSMKHQERNLKQLC